MSLQSFPPQDFESLQKQLQQLLSSKTIATGVHCIRCKHGIWKHDSKKNRQCMVGCMSKECGNGCIYHPYQKWYLDRKWSEASINYRKLLDSKNNKWRYKTTEEKTKMKGKLEEAVSVPDGLHTGSILGEELREVTLPDGKKTEYLDFKVSVDDFKDVESLKFGVPWYNIPTEKSSLGILLTALGVPLGNFDTEKDIVGKKIQYLTNTDKKGYAKVLLESVKPVK